MRHDGFTVACAGAALLLLYFLVMGVRDEWRMRRPPRPPGRRSKYGHSEWR